MIYFYKTISPHLIENLHKYLHYFFSQLFAEVHPTFDHVFYIHTDFKDIVDEYPDINTSLTTITSSYLILSKKDKALVRKIYLHNNAIEEICNNKKKPFPFDDLPLSVQTPIRNLYDSEGLLYSMLTKKTGYPKIKSKCGSLKKHFESFRKVNQYSVCPFCGMENLMTEKETNKNEYDHYFSKGRYPFCSINFNNLVPICDYCNKSGNKGQKDIPFIPRSKPRKQGVLYYPYSQNIPKHEIGLQIISPTTDLSNPKKWNLIISATPKTNEKRKDRWVEIYNIEDRYKGKIAQDSYKWKERIKEKYRMRCKKRGISFKDFKEDILDDFTSYKDINNGIIMKCFDEFIMNNPNCETFLSGNIVF
ncbi:hypothetical protein HDC90_005236 [Pedobacter sp. AK013]|uniref:hypothetical protein n=1 Tax=Pedobacter sp. AK013 TaxID=2723071 RepID=UPI001609EDEA|nr:hypothetical protein [Pedobacter sp. AK013]MBB6240551.1 hypothetical protein [Pedobacter sp. AK013]